MSKSIGAIEFRSISKGIEVCDEIVKKAFVKISYMKSICPGKFLIIVNGDVGEVETAIEYGKEVGKKHIVDSFIINSVHKDIVHALKNKYDSKEVKSAIGIMETYKVCSGITALNKTLKTNDVRLIKLQLAFGIGGKLVYIISGDLSSVRDGLEEGKKAILEKEIVNMSILPSPHYEVIKNLV
ncbi:BMC domain-containing protein [Clostridium tarantellae]|uniref:BMC domain-containing protein n=1 Tax=Clostridium tarantellae TaxID=39493 RepID=A0A6I1MH85_9CLOT|nr:BMC domain-containing protein [Clostridium tarantellae]MPQ42896.1 BMC domain-containing protein [Clostridium tarantellae]